MFWLQNEPILNLICCSGQWQPLGCCVPGCAQMPEAAFNCLGLKGLVITEVEFMQRASLRPATFLEFCHLSCCLVLGSKMFVPFASVLLIF